MQKQEYIGREENRIPYFLTISAFLTLDWYDTILGIVTAKQSVLYQFYQLFKVFYWNVGESMYKFSAKKETKISIVMDVPILII